MNRTKPQSNGCDALGFCSVSMKRKFQHPAYGMPDAFCCQRFFLDAFHECLKCLLSSRHDQVHTGLDGLHLIRPVFSCRKPVGHHDAVKAPFTAQYFGTQFPAVGTVWAHLGKRTHSCHCPVYAGSLRSVLSVSLFQARMMSRTPCIRANIPSQKKRRAVPDHGFCPASVISMLFSEISGPGAPAFMLFCASQA